jgi:hypothetical protein
VVKPRLLTPKKFFDKGGKVANDFWSRAEGDPQAFKYVAYRFPEGRAAQDALASLSFLVQQPGGALKCRVPLYFGVYPHQDKYVCFLGGKELGYAMWREATATFPELPDAEYFRVSDAPAVFLEIPDLEELMREASVEISHVEDREGTGTDYAQYRIYQAADEAGALEFLQRVSVDSEGVHVVVRTPEGTWGKDINGVYQE